MCGALTALGLLVAAASPFCSACMHIRQLPVVSFSTHTHIHTLNPLSPPQQIRVDEALGITPKRDPNRFYHQLRLKNRFKAYLRTWATRRNTENNRLYRNDDAIFSWQLQVIEQILSQKLYHDLKQRRIRFSNAYLFVRAAERAPCRVL